VRSCRRRQKNHDQIETRRYLAKHRPALRT
jgi:hypothetical protein